MKKFFNVNGNYHFEWTDIQALFTIINVVLVMNIGLVAAWVGLAIAIFFFVKNLVADRKLNVFVINLGMIALNIYFLLLI